MTDAHEPTDSADEAMLGRLRAVAKVADGVPAHVVEAARAAFELRDLDAELATLVNDSADTRTAEGNLVLMRGAEEPRTLTFAAGDVTVDLQITATDGDRRVVGLAAGAQPGELTMEYDDGSSVRADVDELGRFALDARAGRARLRLPGPGTPVVTPWTVL
jgi:hypothetical protein